MNFTNIVFGVVGVVSLIFMLFPVTLDEVKKMDPYRLIVLCIFSVCVIYWIYFAVQHSNMLKKLIKTKKRIRIIRDPKDPEEFTYLVEGNECYHIPDSSTFRYLGSYLGFSWKDLEHITTDDFKRKFTIGRQLPSIQAFFPKIELIEKKE